MVNKISKANLSHSSLLKKYSALFSIFCLLFFACVKDKPNIDKPQEIASGNKSIVILNEGSYGLNNADISFLDKEKNIISNQLFSTKNGKYLGDVAQSITLINGSYYVAVNNSSKIVIIDTATFIEKSTITNIHFPRYILPVSNTKAYVSSLYYPEISVLDLTTNKVTKTITTDYINTEQMIMSNGFVYCCNWDTSSNLLYKINPFTDSIIEKISLPGRASHHIVVDKDENIWVLSGNKYKNKKSYLTCIHHDTVLKTFAFPIDADALRLDINATKDTMYYLLVNYNGGNTYNGLYKMSIYDFNLPSNAFIAAQTNTYFWGLGLDYITGHIFLADPKGFSQQSTIIEYNSLGEKINQYQAGIGANSFLFR
jgi:DNA-binding beta-propeller fold protein YncE